MASNKETESETLLETNSAPDWSGNDIKLGQYALPYQFTCMQVGLSSMHSALAAIYLFKVYKNGNDFAPQPQVIKSFVYLCWISLIISIPVRISLPMIPLNGVRWIRSSYYCLKLLYVWTISRILVQLITVMMTIMLVANVWSLLSPLLASCLSLHVIIEMLLTIWEHCQHIEIWCNCWSKAAERN